MWALLINGALIVGGLAVTVHTFLMANVCEDRPVLIKYGLIPACVAGGVLMIHGGLFGTGWGIYAAAATVIPLIAVQIESGKMGG